jgi:HK97 family phage major capsid protein
VDKKTIDDVAKAVKDASSIIALAKKRAEKNKPNQLDAEKVKDIITKAIADMKGDITNVRKGEFTNVDNFTVDNKGGLDSYRYTMLQKSDNATIKELQQMNDDLMIMGSVLACVNKTSFNSAVTSTRLYQKYINHKGVSELRKAIDGTTGKGEEWIPTIFSSDLMDKVRVELKVAALFGRINMPSNPFVLPVEGADAIGYLVTNSSSDDIRDSNAMPLASTPGTANVTFNAAKLGARTVFNEETKEDSIIGIMDYVKSKVVLAIARAIENATCNGSTATTHPDNDIQTDPNSAKLNDRAWDGFRQIIEDASTWTDGATFDIDAFRAARKTMGVYGINPTELAFVVSVSVMYQLLDKTNFDALQTLDKYGPNAVILTGEVGKLDGISVIVSEFQRDNVSATGFNTVGGPNTKSTAAIVNRKAMLYGDRREITTDSERNIETDKTVVVSKVRMDYERLFPTTDTVIGGIRNITP